MKPYRLSGCRVAAAACVLVVAAATQAAAQFPPPPGQASSGGGAFPPQPGAAQQSAFPPPPGQGQPQNSPFPPVGGEGGGTRITVAPSGGGFSQGSAPGGFGGGPPPQMSEAQKICTTFPAIREDVEKSAGMIKSAGARKASREEVCPLFKTFAAKEAKLVSFLQTNQKLCGVPPNIISQMKTNHARTLTMRDNVCSSGPSGPAGPTLSDALGGPIIADDQSSKESGRGTFDTLTGNALQR